MPVASGLTSAGTALELGVKNQIASILRRPELDDRAQLAALVISQHERVRAPAQLESRPSNERGSVELGGREGN
jgi:hypothetical protein